MRIYPLSSWMEWAIVVYFNYANTGRSHENVTVTYYNSITRVPYLRTM